MSGVFTLAISKCYGKVRVLFFPRDNSLISRGNSHVSRVRGLVVRCLLFNPEVSCSNPWVCANFFYKYSEAESSHIFWHYETFRLCETFFRNFLNVTKESSFQFFLIFCNRTNVKKSQKVPFFQNFRHYETVQNPHFLFFKSFQCLHRGLIFCNRTNAKKIPKGPFLQIFRHYETAIKISIFFEIFLKTPKSPPSIFRNFATEWVVKKSPLSQFSTL